jgi:hypothetical protein
MILGINLFWDEGSILVLQRIETLFFVSLTQYIW